MLTKSDFLIFLDAPLHLWATSHGQLEEKLPSAFEQFLAQQGQAVEDMARQYLEQVILSKNDRLRLHWQPTYDDGRFQIRADVLIWDDAVNACDLYEIKSATSAQKTHTYDLAFQALLLKTILPLRDVYLVHINKNYRQSDHLDLENFFVIEPFSEQVNARREEVSLLRQAAWEITQMAEPPSNSACTKPRSCPCPALCHPNLPENPIYNLPHIGQKVVTLRDMGIRAIEDIPQNFTLSERQHLHAEAVRSGQAIINTQAIQTSLGDLHFPLYFLDYETFNPAVPLFPGYHPYEHIVFQYSLFMIAEPAADPCHFEALFTDGSDPAPQIASSLLDHVGQSGSVVVWNKSFEAGRNQDLAQHCPEQAARLLSINERLYDLMLIFRDGHYIDPHFHGSASLKAVLPVLCPDLTYTDLAIRDGESAMLTWYRLHSGAFPPEDRQETITAMKAYCKMDTYGMVAIWDHLRSLCEED